MMLMERQKSFVYEFGFIESKMKKSDKRGERGVF